MMSQGNDGGGLDGRNHLESRGPLLLALTEAAITAMSPTSAGRAATQLKSLHRRKGLLKKYLFFPT